MNQDVQRASQALSPWRPAETEAVARWVRLMQSSGLFGNQEGQLTMESLAQGPGTPPLQTLEQVRAARDRLVAEEDAAEQGAAWWGDAVCADQPMLGDAPPLWSPPVVTPIVPMVGEGLLTRIMAGAARWLGPVVIGMWPKETAGPELADAPYMPPGIGPEL